MLPSKTLCKYRPAPIGRRIQNVSGVVSEGMYHVGTNPSDQGAEVRRSHEVRGSERKKKEKKRKRTLLSLMSMNGECSCQAISMPRSAEDSLNKDCELTTEEGENYLNFGK
jgi:spermidine synthase